MRRVGIDSLMHFERPKEVALLFLMSVLQPWRAYLTRYPDVPLLIVIGDDSAKKLYQPKPSEPEDVTSLRLLRRMPICAHTGADLSMAVYERC